MKKYVLLTLCLLASFVASAAEKVLFDFENYNLGDRIEMKDFFSETTASVAEVVQDPANPNNQVLHVTNKSWNTLIKLPLGQLTAEEMTGTYQYLTFDLYRSAEDGMYKMFVARVDADTIHADTGFFDQGAAQQWLQKSYRMKLITGPGNTLYMGYQSIDADFYIDNVRLVSVDYGYNYFDPKQTLRYYAEKCGKNIGAAVPVWRTNVNDDNLDMTQTIYSNFNMVVAENEMKIDALQPNRGEFTFYNGDCLVNLAERHNMTVRGHTLVWHSQVPGWISSDGKKNDKNYSRAELLQIMKDHITTVVTHYKGKVHEWDVVNECLDDNQTTIRTNPAGYDLRPSVWYTGIGEDFIDSAFMYAHRADPNAKLFINEYGVEFQGKAKTQAYYNLVRRLQKSGIPIDGVGLQCHFTVGEIDSAKLDANVKRYASLNLNCIMTELDISTNLSLPDAYERQAAEYRAVANIFMNYKHCTGLLVWGITDNLSWRGGDPLLFNSQLRAKPAFFALRDVLERNAQTSGMGSDISISEKQPIDVDVYNLYGQLVAKKLHRSRIKQLPAGIYIIDRKTMMIR
ncbi:endo-1,4-beta-xylanase [Bacteroidales bacterium OttesenSCG-928-L03]|nr:endo-1,4-beta-xylanase [Bacteroidales bacterium OttesenSCG-928-L03]